MEYETALTHIDEITNGPDCQLKRNLTEAMTNTNFYAAARDAKRLSEILDALVKHSLESSQIFDRKAGAYRALNPTSRKQKLEN